MGDFWGVEKYHGDMDTHNGVSALLVNSEKGAALISKTSERMKMIPTKEENISKANNLLLNGKNRNRALVLVSILTS